jgi:hypothetical protein
VFKENLQILKPIKVLVGFSPNIKTNKSIGGFSLLTMVKNVIWKENV